MLVVDHFGVQIAENRMLLRKLHCLSFYRAIQVFIAVVQVLVYFNDTVLLDI